MSKFLKILKPNFSKQIRYFSRSVQNEDICIKVSESDEILGSIGKVECHKQPLSLHRAFSVFLFNDENKLLLQKRSLNKVTFPGVWSNTCCSHPLYNDSEIKEKDNKGIKMAACRRMGQELGLWNIPEDKFEVAGRFLYKAVMDDVWGEFELDYSLILRNINISNKYKLNRDEVDKVMFVNFIELQNMIQSGEKFSPWFMLFNRHGFIKKWFEDLTMHNIWARFNNVLAFTLTVLAASTFLAFVSSHILAKSTVATLNARNVRVKNIPSRIPGTPNNDFAHMELDIEVDLSDVFNWNVKELFVYLVADYKTKKNAFNQVTLWDQVVLRSDRVVINEKDLYPEYYFFDDGSNLLKHDNVSLTLNWEVIPNAGFMFHERAKGTHRIQFPSSYTVGRL
ncbi:CG5919 protein [Strongyloides ratti]|uniref:isopentenyl-diphosphate Delta-isomerase n=1 Tax=Strongyloides ratti TaxID=34506 RepID=A0A090LH32_STRRB|nr:CG5919 protein [Strongyloides ratti]CEF67443.1 CG5919 protein [Strongyloides ratti]